MKYLIAKVSHDWEVPLVTPMCIVNNYNEFLTQSYEVYAVMPDGNLELVWDTEMIWDIWDYDEELKREKEIEHEKEVEELLDIEQHLEFPTKESKRAQRRKATAKHKRTTKPYKAKDAWYDDVRTKWVRRNQEFADREIREYGR